MKNAKEHFFGSAECAHMEWPTSEAVLQGPLQYAKELFDLIAEFFKTAFPDYEWRSKFGAFRCGSDALPEQVRLDMIEDLALKEGVNPTQARLQFSLLLRHVKRLYATHQDDKKVFAELLENLRVKPGGRFRPDAAGVVSMANDGNPFGSLNRFLCSRLCANRAVAL